MEFGPSSRPRDCAAADFEAENEASLVVSGSRDGGANGVKKSDILYYIKYTLLYLLHRNTLRHRNSQKGLNCVV